MPTHADGADDAAHLALAAPDGEDAEARSRAFHFPYPVAYDVQLALMTALFDAIEHRRAGVFESPTGTVRPPALTTGQDPQLAMQRLHLAASQPAPRRNRHRTAARHRRARLGRGP